MEYYVTKDKFKMYKCVRFSQYFQVLVGCQPAQSSALKNEAVEVKQVATVRLTSQTMVTL